MTPEEYKDAQKKRIASYQVGNKDVNGNSITKIFGRGDEYVVYEIQTQDLVDSEKVHIDTETEIDQKGLINRWDKVRGKFAQVKGVLYKAVDKTVVKTMIAHILINGIVHDPDGAINEFDALIKSIDKEYQDQFKNRMRLLLSSLVFALGVIFLGVCTYYNGWYSVHSHIRQLLYVIAAGCVGGFFSVAISVNKVVCEKSVAYWLYILYGVQRMCISVLAAAIVYFAVEGDLIGSIINKMGNRTVGLIIFGILAGFSETFVPNFLSDMEKKK